MQDKEKIYLEISLDINEYFEFNNHHYRKIITSGLFLCFLLYYFMFLFIAVMESGWGRFSNHIWLFSIITLPIGIVLVLVLFLFFRRQIKKKSNKDFLSNPNIYKNQQIEISSLGIEKRNEIEMLTIGWNWILDVIELKNIYIVYYARNRAFILPKHCFRNQETHDSFKCIVRQNLITDNILNRYSIKDS